MNFQQHKQKANTDNGTSEVVLKNLSANKFQFLTAIFTNMRKCKYLILGLCLLVTGGKAFADNFTSD